LPGLRVAALPRLAPGDLKRSEPDQQDLLLLLQGFGDDREDRLDGIGGIRLGEVGRGGDGRNQIMLVHEQVPANPAASSVVAARKRRQRRIPHFVGSSPTDTQNMGQTRRSPGSLRGSAPLFVDFRQWATTASDPSDGFFATGSTRSSVHSTATSGWTSARASTSSTVETGTISSPFFTLSGISGRSRSFSLGMSTVLRPPRNAASSFSLRPPIGSTRPRRLISPVIATSLRTGFPVSAETIEVIIATPAEGPSLGVAPSGTCTWMSRFSNMLRLIPNAAARERT